VVEQLAGQPALLAEWEIATISSFGAGFPFTVASG